LEKIQNDRHEHPDWSGDSARKRTIREDIARRIRRVCGHLTEKDFQLLVDQMTERQMRAERRANRI
jgi:hypothetical protein